MREGLIQTAVCDYAKSKGWSISRFATRSFPDRMFMRSGSVFMIEFKATGRKPSKQQDRTIKKIRDNGFVVFVVDNVAEGKQAVDVMSGIN